MKNKMSVIITLVVMSLMLTVYAYSDTSRLGAETYTFNQTATVSKTAAYTLISTDSLCKVSAATASVTITLPALSSLNTGVKSYKILKTDSTTNAVIVAPATGDTIGGESQRYIMGQNDYIVVSKGTNSSWQVDAESSYHVDNHSSGVITMKTSATVPIAAFGITTTAQFKNGKGLLGYIMPPAGSNTGTYFKNVSGVVYKLEVNSAAGTLKAVRAPNGY